MPPAASPPTTDRLWGAVLAGGERVEVEVSRASGLVVSVRELGGREAPPPDALDLTGYVLLPAPAEPHAHLDKALTWDAIRPDAGDLDAAIVSWRRHAETMAEEDIEERAERQAIEMLAHGTTAVRSHVDVLLGDDPLRGIRALVRVRERLAGRMDLQVVAMGGRDVPTPVLEAALDAGADLVGGAPHLAPDPLEDMAALIDVAERRGRGIDLHVDENLDRAPTLAAFALRVAGWDPPPVAGHCVRLSTMEASERAEVLRTVAQAGLGIVVNPITNLYLQGRGLAGATPRAVPPVREILDAGVRLAAGADNVRDPFNPVGRGDALETAALLVVVAHVSVEEAYAAVSTGARALLGLPVAGPTPGARADLVAVRAASLAEAVARAPADRVVVRGGRLVATTATTVWTAPLDPSPPDDDLAPTDDDPSGGAA